MRKTILKSMLCCVPILWAGCGSSTSQKSDATAGGESARSGYHRPVPPRADIPSLVTAGEAQQVAFGKPVELYASRIDRTRNFTGYIWKEGSRILGEGAHLRVEDLEPGVHEILLEAIGDDGEIYTATVRVTIEPKIDSDQMPEAAELHFRTTEDTPFHGALRGSDRDGDALRYLIVALPEHGRLTGSAAHLTYIPDPDFYGEDRFVFKTNDGSIDSDPSEVSISVVPVNDAPLAAPIQAETIEDEAVRIVPQAEDVDHDPLTYRIVSTPAHGRVEVSEGAFLYRPEQGFYGEDRFTYVASDGMVDSAVVTVTVTVAHVNHLPEVTDRYLEVPEDALLTQQFPAVDIDGDPLTYRLLQPATLAEAWFDTNATLHYIPHPNVNGTERLQYRINDTHADSDTATITIKILPRNDAPVAEDIAVETDEDHNRTFALHATDIDGDTLSYAIVSEPHNGILQREGAQVTYMPAAGFSGTDTFRYKASDGATDSNVATVTVTVRAVNHAPIGRDLSVSLQQDSSVDILLPGSDSDGDSLTFYHTQPAHGTLTGNGDSLRYSPPSGYTGSDTFTYWISDGKLDSPHYSVSVEVTQRPNSRPVVQDLNMTLAEDENSTFALQASDADGQPLTYRITSQPLHGTLIQNGSEITYRPQQDFYGSDRFRYIASDGIDDSAEAEVSLTVTPVNDLPVAFGAAYTLSEDSNLSVTLQGSDTENEPLLYHIVTQPQNGSLTCQANSCLYQPQPDFNGADRFTFTVEDSTGGMSAPATVTLQIAVQNDAPVAYALSADTAEDRNVTVTLEATDVENDPLTYRIESYPQHGSVVLTENRATYQPEADYSGTDTFQFVAVDSGGLTSQAARVDITVTPVNDLPVANVQSLATDEDTPLSLRLTGSDRDGDTLTCEIVQQPRSGTLSGTLPDLTYVPAADFYGEERFTFVVSDGNATSEEANVTITVNPINDAPVADAGSDMQVAAGEAVVLDASGSHDVDDTTLTYAWYEGTTLLGTGKQLRLDSLPEGIHTLSLIVTDPQGLSDSDSVTVTVTSLFSRQILLQGLPPVMQIFAEDVDTDGGKDIVLVSGTPTDASISWYKKGSSGYILQGSIVSGKAVQVATVSDVDSDGDYDIIYGKDALFICLNDGNGTFSCQENYLYNGMRSDDNMQAIVVADMDGDADKDIVVTTNAILEHKLLFYRQSGGQFSRSDSFIIDSDIGSSAFRDIAVADIDRDGDSDIALSGESGVLFYSNDLNATAFSKSSVHTSDTKEISFLGMREFNSAFSLVSLFTDGTTGVDDLPGSVLYDQLPATAFVDLDRDGWADFVPAEGDNGEAVWFRGDGNGALRRVVLDRLQTANSVLEYTADLNSDGKIDIIAVTDEGTLYFYENMQ